MFAMVLLSFSVLVRSFRARAALVANGTLNPRYFKTYQEGVEPEASVQLARNFTNQFEAPVLFYAACSSAIAMQIASMPMTTLAWSHFALRLLHSHIHTGTNKLRSRIYAYFAGWIVLLALWVALIFSANTH
jgi:hypothetical protein